MRISTLNRFKKVFEGEKKELLYSHNVIDEDFAVNKDDRLDEADQAATDTEQGMRMRLRNRERLYIKKIEEALRRIESGSFGECSVCEEDIELKRLNARPTATHCVGCKEEQERSETSTAHGRKSKSLGEGFNRRIG